MNEEILNSYIDAALATSVDDQDEPLDERHGVEDIDPLTKLNMLRDVTQAEFLADAFVPNWRSYWSSSQFGHDFWLTRCGHGSGFWDRAPTHPSEEGEVGDKLTTIARSFDSVDLYVGDDGVIYAL